MSYDENRISDLIDGGLKKEQEMYDSIRVFKTSKGTHKCKNCGVEFIKIGKMVHCSARCKNLFKKYKRPHMPTKTHGLYRCESMADFKNEEWRSIDGYEGFMVSNMGRVKRFSNHVTDRNGRFYKTKEFITYGCTEPAGYFRVSVLKNGKNVYIGVHKLVGLAFLGFRTDDYQVNHINGIKKDNRVENLEWVTPKENVQHAIKSGLRNSYHMAKLSKEEVLSIRVDKRSSRVLGKIYGVSKTQILSIRNRKCWADL